MNDVGARPPLSPPQLAAVEAPSGVFVDAGAGSGKTTVLVERYATLGGVCLNVGCIPS